MGVVRVGKDSRFAHYVKTADETKTSDNTFADDAELKDMAVGASKRYFVEFMLLCNANATPDQKFQFVVPSGATFKALLCGEVGTLTNANMGGDPNTVTTSFIIIGDGADSYAMGWGLLITSTTAGNLDLQWAQNVSDANPTKLLAGSFVKLTELT